MALLQLYRDNVSEEQLKSEIQEIVRSYRHSWDVFSEPIQNAIDSINRRFRIHNDPEYYLYNEYREKYGEISPDPSYEGELNIVFNVDDSSITIKDNGVGMEPESMEKYLLPKGSNKKVGKDYGFKGYGLTFITFVSEKFELTSKFLLNENAFHLEMDNCFQWLSGDVEFPNGPNCTPQIKEENTIEQSGTELKVTLSDDYTENFAAAASLDEVKDYVRSEEDIKKLKYILRSRTAIGNTRYLFGDNPIVNINVKLKVILNGVEYDETVLYNYYHPKEHAEIKVLSYDFETYVESIKNVAFQRDFRALYHPIKEQEVGTMKKVKFDVAICAISQTRLGHVERSFEIPKYSDYGISHGVHLSINGMPTGIRIDNWDSKGGHLKRYFAVVDTDLSMSEQLDSGRKGVSKHFANLISEHVIGLLSTKIDENPSSFGSWAHKHLDTGKTNNDEFENDDFQTVIEKVQEEKERYTEEEINILEKVKKYSSFNKIPSTENEVIALFYHLLDRGIIKGYNTEYLSGNATYDAAFSYRLEFTEDVSSESSPIGIAPAIIQDEKSKGRNYYDLAKYRRASPELCVEFKRNVGGLLSEIQGKQGKTDKNPEFIDLLICWDISIPNSIESTTYSIGEIHNMQRKYHGTTHRLGIITPEKNTEVHCIVLKDILSKIE
ncbi:ATP-binding protein [Bacillus thuringiensis]|uniref:ATP-binding protein n=1 Tax=Bacillus thuringiensis TaxID=1428 RepID=UPI0020C5A53D|nr:ATP-binding protein [Bacillus cereus]